MYGNHSMKSGCRNQRTFCKYILFSLLTHFGLQDYSLISHPSTICRVEVGVREDLMGWDVHEGDGLAHYARACTDVTFRFPFGVQELMGIAARGNFDLTQHTEGSGKCM